MAGPALAIQIILLIAWFGLIVLLLAYTIIKRHSLKESIPSGVLFLGLSVISSYVFYLMKHNEYNEAEKFLGDYKLERLDTRKCENCKVRLKDGYTYDILVNDQVVGQGKWHLEMAIDIPGPFLRIDFGPTYAVWEHDRLIKYIDRTQDR